jgi:hypothetical protein
VDILDRGVGGRRAVAHGASLRTTNHPGVGSRRAEHECLDSWS